MPAQKVVFEYLAVHGNKITKRIQFLEDRLGYSVLEQDKIEDRFKPIGGGDRWDTIFFLPATQRNIARTALIGRLLMSAYCEGNPGTGD